MEMSTPELAIKYYSKPEGMSVKAAEIHHVPQLQCFGYTLQEPWTQPRSLNVEAARALGVTSAISYRMLKSGFPAFNDDRTRQVEADEVCGEVPRPRKVTVLGDCCLVPPAMEMLAMNSDVLVHEATLAVTDKGNKVAVGGHSSAAQAAVFANKVNANVLILNHLPKKANTYKGIKECLDEAESRIRGATKVQLGYDHLEILIPRKGFEFGESKPTRSLWLHEREVTALTAKTGQSDRSERLAITQGGKFSA
jgi:ribonuclease BN (tRNA processing enzyme)